MTSRRFFLTAALFFAAFCVLEPALAAPAGKDPIEKTASVASASPSDVVKNFYTQLTSVMKSGDKLGFSGRYKKLDPAVRASFNLPLMTRFSVGSVWSSATAQEQEQLVSAFSDFSVATYASRFATYDGEKFEVVGEKPTTGGVIVQSRLTPKDGDAVALDYLVKKDEAGAYRIVDVFLDGAISELATRRSEFGAIVDRDGVAALVNSLSAKSRQMGPS